MVKPQNPKGEYYTEIGDICTVIEFWDSVSDSCDFRDDVYEKMESENIDEIEAHDLVLEEWKDQGINEIAGSYLRSDGLVETDISYC